MKLNIGTSPEYTFTTLDLGEPDEKYGYFETGDLSDTAGNLYLYLDGQEIGSIFFYREEDGRITATLGRFDPDKEEWDEKNPLEINQREEEK